MANLFAVETCSVGAILCCVGALKAIATVLGDILDVDVDSVALTVLIEGSEV